MRAAHLHDCILVCSLLLEYIYQKGSNIDVDNYHRSFGLWVRVTSVLIYAVYYIMMCVQSGTNSYSRREDMCWSVRYWLDISTRKEARC